MAVSIYPTPSLSTSNTQFITIPDGNTLRSTQMSLQAGVYNIVATNASYNTKIRLYNGSTLVTTVTTTGLTPVVLNLATPVTKVWAHSQVGAPSLQVGFTLTGVTLANTQITGTLDTITSSSNYTVTNQTAYIVAIGGGGGGNSTDNSGYGGGGGGSGAVVELGPVLLNGTYAVTIGTGGAGTSQTNNNRSVSGGSTIFGSLLTAGGGCFGGNGPYGGDGGPYGSASGTYDWAGGSYGAKGQNGGGSNNQNAFPSVYPPVSQWTVSGSVAGGNGGGFSGTATAGLGTNIGTGGHSAYGNATGFGCGGGGFKSGTAVGSGNGSAGVVYVLKVSTDQ
jgi:hypothetical protein